MTNKTLTITARKYDEMMGVLPPAAMGQNKEQHMSGFLVGEPTTHNAAGLPVYASYFSADDQYWAGPDMTIPEFNEAIAKTEQELRDNEETPADVQEELDLREEHGDGIVDAYISLGMGDLKDLKEAYSGTFSSDEEFAKHMANDTGALDDDDDIHWPYTCIDWERAARDLMYDYSEADGYYFRNL
jgi:hypothetical protein